LLETREESFVDAESVKGVTVDKEAGYIRNVCILGPYSKSGYAIADEAISEAMPRYEGKPVFLNHYLLTEEGKRKGPKSRDVRDYTGNVRNVRKVEGRLRADLQLTGPNKDMALAAAEACGQGVGMSHVAQYGYSKDRKKVERIGEVYSVDLVAFPATVDTFAESERTAELEQIDKIAQSLKGGKQPALDALKIVCETVGVEFNADNFEVPIAGVQCESEQDLQELAKTRPWLAKRLSNGEKAGKREIARKVIKDNGRDLVVGTESLIDALASQDEASMKTTVVAMAESIAALKRPKSAARTDAKDDVTSKDFISSVRKGK